LVQGGLQLSPRHEIVADQPSLGKGDLLPRLFPFDLPGHQQDIPVKAMEFLEEFLLQEAALGLRAGNQHHKVVEDGKVHFFQAAQRAHVDQVHPGLLQVSEFSAQVGLARHIGDPTGIKLFDDPLVGLGTHPGGVAREDVQLVGDEHAGNLFIADPQAVVRNDPVQVMALDQFLHQFLFLGHGLEYLGGVPDHLDLEVPCLFGIADFIGRELKPREVGKFLLQQHQGHAVGGQIGPVAMFEQGTDDRDAAGGMPQAPVQRGHQDSFRSGHNCKGTSYGMILVFLSFAKSLNN